MLTATRIVMTDPDLGDDLVLWDADGLTSLGEEVYTAGDCWVLAWHLTQAARARGLEAAMVTLGELDSWWHVAVRINGRYLDALGFHTSDAIRAHWGREIEDQVFADLDFPAYEAALGGYWEYKAGHEEAAEIARLIVFAHFG